MFTPHEPPPRARDIGRIPFPRLTPWAGPGAYDPKQLATPSPLHVSTPITPGQPAQQGEDARPAQQTSLPQTSTPLVMWSSKISHQARQNQGQIGSTLESLPRPSTSLQRSREEKTRQAPAHWGAAQKQSAEVWSPGLPRFARADPSLTKPPASNGNTPSWAAPDPEGRLWESRDRPSASREEHAKVLKDEHAPKTLSRLSRPSGGSGAGLTASPGAAGDEDERRVTESPRFSVLRAHLQGLTLRKCEQEGVNGSSSGSIALNPKSATWRPMQSSAPRPQRSIGSGKLKIRSPASDLTGTSSPASAAANPQHTKPHGRIRPSKHDSAESALPMEAPHPAANDRRGWDTKSSSAFHKSMRLPGTRPPVSSSAEKSSSPLQGSALLLGERLAPSSSPGAAAQHKKNAFGWEAERSGHPPELDGIAERMHISLQPGTAPEDPKEESRIKMKELLASMGDLMGDQALPVLAAHVHAAPQPAPRMQHHGAAEATVTEQLSALQTLQQEGTQAFSEAQSPDARQKAAPNIPRLTKVSTVAAYRQSGTSPGQVKMSEQKAQRRWRVGGPDAFDRAERNVPDTDDSPRIAHQRGSSELLSQLQRLQALQAEAQGLLM